MFGHGGRSFNLANSTLEMIDTPATEPAGSLFSLDKWPSLRKDAFPLIAFLPTEKSSIGNAAIGRTKLRARLPSACCPDCVSRINANC